MKDLDQISNANRAMWRGALIPATFVALLAVIAATIVRHRSGLLGALLASFVVVIFFSTSLLVAKLTKSADPISTMALAMFS
jgi:hypothetical protein